MAGYPAYGTLFLLPRMQMALIGSAILVAAPGLALSFALPAPVLLPALAMLWLCLAAMLTLAASERLRDLAGALVLFACAAATLSDGAGLLRWFASAAGG